MSFRPTCYHCGDSCNFTLVHYDEKDFCCRGCKTVYEILSGNDLKDYYSIENRPGNKKSEENRFSDYGFLDSEDIMRELRLYSDDKMESVKWSVPGIHCSSCIWLLERLNRLNNGILKSEVNFLKKELVVTYNKNSLSMRTLAELMASLGYRPDFALGEKGFGEVKKRQDRQFIYKLGISGFAFGNIMLLSFPEYFSEGLYLDAQFGKFFGYVNLLLALPVFFYCSSSYFSSAWKGLRHGILNIDLPVALGIFVLFARSVYEIIGRTGPGYMDSMTGLVFFLLIGRWFQNRTYQALSFEKDYRNYFPLSVTRKKGDLSENVLLSGIRKGDQLIIRNGELIPADSFLINAKAMIDYSFVTGESDPVKIGQGELIYAGGRQSGGQIVVEIEREFSQSYLMQLWKNEAGDDMHGKSMNNLINAVSHYFTLTILSVATITGIYWFMADERVLVHAVSSVLIIACPCALALTIPFTYGNGIRILEKAGFYLRDSKIIEKISEITTIVFDKTGTITSGMMKEVSYSGRDLSAQELRCVKSVLINSFHPLSRSISEFIKSGITEPSEEFSEKRGYGVSGRAEGKQIRLGNSEFTGNGENDNGGVHLLIDGGYVGEFKLKNVYRPGLQDLINKMKRQFSLEVMTGDGDSERENLVNYFGTETAMQFRMTPVDKLQYIRELQEKGQSVMMIGDGLNDAGAIRESHAGVSISDDIYGYLPSCDAILEANSFGALDNIIRFCRSSVNMVKVGFAISFAYNITGMYFAVQGVLSPVIAAVLMPLSSMTIALFAISSTSLLAKKYKFEKADESQSNA